LVFEKKKAQKKKKNPLGILVVELGRKKKEKKM
jgi:hypothetical protein